MDSKGNLYVSEAKTGNVVSYHPNAYPFAGTPSYEAPTTIDASGNAKGISVDPYDDRLYVAEGDHVAVYDQDDGATGQDEVQRVRPFNATGGTYTLSFEGQPTAPLAYEATPPKCRPPSKPSPQSGPATSPSPRAPTRNHQTSWSPSSANLPAPM